MEPSKPDIDTDTDTDPIKTKPTYQDPESSISSEDILEGTKLVATRTATTTASTLVGHTASATLSSTTSSVLGHSGASILASSVGQSVLAGGMSTVGAIGGAFFAKDKKRALARGIPSVIIALIPGVGIPLAIGANVVGSLVVDKIYTTIKNMNKDYIDLPIFVPERVQIALDSLISQITKKLEAASMNFTMVKSTGFDLNRLFEIAGKFKRRAKMFEKASEERFKIAKECNFGEHLLLLREFFREVVINICYATREVDEVIEFLEKYLAMLSNNDGKKKTKEGKAIPDIIKALKSLNDELKVRIGTELKNGLEKCELFVETEMERIASELAPEPKENDLKEL